MYVYCQSGWGNGSVKIQSVCVIVYEGDEERASMCELGARIYWRTDRNKFSSPVYMLFLLASAFFLFLSQKSYMKCNIFIMYKIQYFLCHTYAYVMHDVWFRLRFYNVAYWVICCIGCAAQCHFSAQCHGVHHRRRRLSLSATSGERTRRSARRASDICPTTLPCRQWP